MEVMQALVELGTDVNAKNKVGNTPLHQVSRNGNIRCLRMLLELNARVDEANNDSSSPLHLASKAGKLQTCQILIEHGADEKRKNNFRRTPLDDAANDEVRDVILTTAEERDEANALSPRDSEDLAEIDAAAAEVTQLQAEKEKEHARRQAASSEPAQAAGEPEADK